MLLFSLCVKITLSLRI